MSDAPNHLAQDLTAPPRKPWLTWLLVLLFGLGIAAWLAGPSLIAQARGAYVKRCAAAAQEHIEAGNWAAAGQAIAQARRWSPDDPAVLRLVADFLFKTASDPNGLIYTLRRLEESGQATLKDRVRLGQAFLNQNNIASARAALNRFNAVERAMRLPLELEAGILRQEGRLAEAEAVLRRSLQLAPNDPAARLRLALLDHQATFAEMRKEARHTLWELARAGDATALAAIDFLAGNAELTHGEAAELQRLIDAHPAPKPAVRLRVISALLRLRPQAREELVTAEISRYQGKSPSDLPELLNWLNREGEAGRVLDLLPPTLATRSAELLQAKLEALSKLNRWADVQRILAKPAGLPVSAAFVSVWMADAHRHQNDPARARQQLMMAYEASGRGKEGFTAMRAAELAESMGFWDIASLCYAGLAETHVQAEIPMLEKVRDMALRDRNTAAVVKAARRLVELRPANAAYLDALLYLRLVTGEDIELTVRQLRDQPAGRSNPAGTLHQALAAYRLGDINAVREALPRIRDPGALPAGQRAVYAGLLNTTGQVGPAFEFAEKVPAALLLPEELRFLQRAR